MNQDQQRDSLKTLADRYEQADDYNKPSIAFYIRKMFAKVVGARKPN